MLARSTERCDRCDAHTQARRGAVVMAGRRKFYLVLAALVLGLCIVCLAVWLTRDLSLAGLLFAAIIGVLLLLWERVRGGG
jgi:lipopolysaccharide export LptBFGC system permease protein LptF